MPRDCLSELGELLRPISLSAFQRQDAQLQFCQAGLQTGDCVLKRDDGAVFVGDGAHLRFQRLDALRQVFDCRGVVLAAAHQVIWRQAVRTFADCQRNQARRNAPHGVNLVIDVTRHDDGVGAQRHAVLDTQAAQQPGQGGCCGVAQYAIALQANKEKLACRVGGRLDAGPGGIVQRVDTPGRVLVFHVLIRCAVLVNHVMHALGPGSRVPTLHGGRS
ncbi:MAG: hypothetical protein HONDAALG_03949 [Gammaproteobacteria bacterium]|nr:hypothetical protein [Gammaproteobacteria bacterium]